MTFKIGLLYYAGFVCLLNFFLLSKLGNLKLYKANLIFPSMRERARAHDYDLVS